MSLDMLPLLSKAGEKALGRLAQKKYRQQESLFVAEGVRLVEEALEAGVTINWAVVAEAAGDRARELVQRLLGLDVPVYLARENVLRARLDPASPQPLAAVCEIPETSIESLSLPERSLVVVCDSFSQPGNLGAVIRVAAAAGADAVLVGPGTVDPWNPKCVRGSMGALFRLPVAVAHEAGELKAFLENGRFALFEASSINGENVFSIHSFPPRTALILGSEAAGVSGSMEGLERKAVSVPMAPGVESLNVAVAAGIILYHIAGSRGLIFRQDYP
ncbi:MAG: RNA methyltransferase [Gemmatimonadota bacterium]|nr:RNA methyltransferase [Gemmatimonadota bacterium]